MNIPLVLQKIRPNADWSLNGEEYSGLEWLDVVQTKPTIEELEAWTPPAPTPLWPNAQAFMAAFTMPEKVAISLSTDPTTAALRLELTTWQSTVEPSHALVQTGLNKLVEIGIISEARKAEIIATATDN